MVEWLICNQFMGIQIPPPALVIIVYVVLEYENGGHLTWLIS